MLLKLMIVQLILGLAIKLFGAHKKVMSVGTEFLPYQVAFILDFINTVFIMVTCDQTIIAILMFVRIAIVYMLKYIYDERANQIMNGAILITVGSLAFEFLR
jgi:hypothetical protein